MNFSKKPQPDKSAVSPVRSVAIIADDKNENNNESINKFANLNASVESKRNFLNKLYDDIKTTSEKLKDNNPTILKHVHFESVDDDDDDDNDNKEKPIFNATYTVDQINLKEIKSSPLASIGNKTKSPITTKQADKTKSVKKVQNISNKITSIKTNSMSPSSAKIVKPKPQLTLQQKRQKLLEEKAKQKQDLDILKRKVIIRKYSYIWLRRFIYSDQYRRFQFSQSVFSGFKFLLPSQAIFYHNQRYLSVSLRIWHENVRFQRNLWRRNIKANCHFKYVILNKLWKQWREFVVLQKEEAKNENIANNFFGRKLKQKYINGWIKETNEVVKKKDKLNQVKEQCNRELLKIWYCKYTDRYLELKSYRIADEQYRYVQLTKCYSVWYSKFKNGTDNRHKLRLAEKHYKIRLLKKFFHSMKIYRIYRRKKTIQKLKLNEYYESQLVYRVYQTWVKKYEVRKKINQLEDVVVNFRTRYLEARVFQFWKSAFKYKVELRFREIKMKKYYEKCLKRKVFEAIKLNYDQVKNQQLNETKAQVFERFWIKKIFFSKWSDKLEEKKEINSMHLMYKANKFYETSLILRYFNEWKIFLLDTKKMNTKNQIAQKHYSAIISKKYFEAIKVYVQITNIKRENYRIAIEYERNNTCHRILTAWVRKYELSLETQMNTRIAILHHESKVKINLFNKWLKKMNDLLKEELNEKLAIVNYRRILIKSSFKIWKNTVNETKSDFINEILAVKHDFKRTCLPMFNNWKLYKQNSSAYKKKCDESTKIYHKNLSRKILQFWIVQTKEFKKINKRTNELFKKKQMEKKEYCFNQWLDQTRLSKAEKDNEQIAITFYLKHLMIKILRDWNLYASNRLIKKRNDFLMLAKFEKIKKNLILNKYYSVWYQRSIESIKYENNFNLAIKFYNNNVCRRSFSAWRIYLKHCWHKKILKNQAIMFSEMKLKTEFYYKWSLKYQQELNSRDKNQQALILWSINIQRKCYQAWFEWFKFKKQKKKRYKTVIEQRQIELLKICGRNFLKFSTDSIVRRMKMTKQLKEKYLIDSVELEYKYFHIWLSKCKFDSLKTRQKNNSYNNVSQLKVDSILVKATLEKADKLNDEYYAAIKSDKLTKIRPPPRKPVFLNDSIDFSNPNSLVNDQRLFEASQLTQILEKPTFQESVIPVEFSKPATILLPPSAFISPLINKIQNEQIMYHTSQIESNIPINKSPSSTVSNSDQEELKLELNLKKMNSVPNLNSTGDVTNRTYLSDANKLEQQKKPKLTNRTKQEQLELVDLKKRLEIISIKSEKLKRVKEQEKLLIKCIESAEINKSSMCDTIYEERDQVQSEIEELNKFLRIEKAQVAEMAKKYNLS